jgi:hypothetical protein
MATFNVRAPDGSLMKISGPEDATDEELIQIAEQNYQPKEKKSKDISLGERVKDVGAGLVSGVGALAQLPGQLSGLAGLTELDNTGLQGVGKNIQQYGQEMKSAGLKAREQERSEKIREAEKTGQLSAATTAFAETIKDPALLLNFLAEQAPQLVVPFGAAKGASAITGAKALGRGLAAEEAALAAGQAGTKAAVGTGAVQQGADIGAGSYENIYKELVDKGIDPSDAKESALNLARAAGASGALISLLAQRLPGARSMEEALAGVPGTGGRIAGAVTAGLGESLGEVAEETGGRFSQNLAMRSVNPEQSLTEGLGEAAGMAAIGGVGMGGISGALRRQQQELQNPTAPSTDVYVPPVDTTIPPDTGLQNTIEAATGVNRPAPDVTPMSMEEAGIQRILNLQSKVDTDVAANQERAAREGIAPVVPPTPERADVSKPSLDVAQLPQAASPEQLQAKQAEIDKLRLDAGLPTGASSKTPGVQPTAEVPTEAPRTRIVDERPMGERLAKNRLLVLKNMLKNKGGDPESLAIVPHPTAEGKFAIQSEDKPTKLTPELPANAINRPDTQPIIDPVNAYMEIARRTNTPASIRLVRDFDAGIVTREDIQDAIDAEHKAGQPLPLTYLENGEPGIVAAPTYKPRGERFLPPFNQVPQTTAVETPTEVPTETPEVEPPVSTNEMPKTLAEFKARMPIAGDNPEIRSANEKGNFAELANHLAASSNPAVKRIGQLARNVASKIKLRKPGPLGAGVLGVYRYADDSIQMAKSAAGDEHTNAHETLHALISKAQRYPTERQKPIAEKIVKLYKHVKKELQRQGKNYYGLTNEREFTAEAMSNPEFQYELMNIEYGGRRSAWTEFTRLVADLLGIKNNNALTEVMTLVDRLAQTKQPRAVKSDKGEMDYAIQMPFGKKEAEPTPVGAGVRGMQILSELGRGNQEPDPTTLEKIGNVLKSARDNPKATAEAAKLSTSNFLDRLETWTFSSDAALNNRIREEIRNSTLSSEEKIGLMLNASLSQTVHSDAVASLFLQRGAIRYNEELHKWEGVENQSNFVKLSKQLDAMADKNGLTKQQAELVAHTAFEAKRLRSILQFNAELEQKIADVQAEAQAKRASSPVAASALSEKASRLKGQMKFVSPQQEAMIAPAMELFKVHPELNEVVKTWNEIRENTVKTLVDTGLWSVNEAEEMLSNADYVPFYREEQLENNQGPKGFISGLQVKAKEHRLQGSDRPVNDIFENQVLWVQYSINRAVRNRSALALAETAVQVGAAKQVKSMKDGNNVVRVWRNGEEQYFSMDDPMFMEAFTGLEAIVIPSWKWASDLANLLRQSVVMYPLFSVAQVPQDSFAAMFSSGLKPQYALRIPVLAVKEFVKTLVGKSRTHEELKNVGAVGVRDFTSAMVRMDAEIYSGLKAPPGVMGKIKNSLNHIAMSADNAVRQAVYEASMAQGLSRAEAMEKAFDVFNVRRKGSSKSLALAGQLIPFFSAYLAAQNVAYKTITGRGISPTDRQEAFKTLAATTASVMVMSLLYAMLNGDDEDYLKKPATVRDRLLMIPGTGGMSIPLRADLFTMPKMITEHMYLTMTDKGYEDGRKFRDSMKAALGSALLGPTAVPQAIKPLVEVGINYDFFQGRPLVGTYQQKLDTERQFTDSTSELGKILGKTGLVSPIAADHLIRGMFGSAGGLIIYATNPMLHSDPNTPRPSLSERDAIATLPGMSGFMTKSYESALKKDFYTLKEEVDKAANTMNDLKTRSPQEIEGFLAKEENLSRVGLQKSVNAIGERLSNIRKAITQTTNSSMDADEKERQIKILRDAEEQMLQAVDVKKLRELGKI